MEEVLGFIGFSLGASLGASATRSLGEGVRPLIRNALKLGIRAWDATATASSTLRAETADAADEVVAPEARPRRRGAPQKIAIARN